MKYTTERKRIPKMTSHPPEALSLTREIDIHINKYFNSIKTVHSAMKLQKGKRSLLSGYKNTSWRMSFRGWMVFQLIAQNKTGKKTIFWSEPTLIKYLLPCVVCYLFMLTSYLPISLTVTGTMYHSSLLLPHHITHRTVCTCLK